MKNLKVKNVIISKQPEGSKNFKDFLEIVKSNNIKLIIVNKGDRINIESGVYIDILWPNNSKFIAENALNNNSIVCKLNYYNFSILFTGDIEAIAEKEILELYRNNLTILNSNILKIAHHGSSSSSIEDFIKLVNPKIALIGVGEKNKYNHPSKKTIKLLQKYNVKILRTDVCGEIQILLKSQGKIEIKKYVKIAKKISKIY